MAGPKWSSQPREDPCVARVEEILEAASSRRQVVESPGEGRPVASHALWLCACVTSDDSPVWLIYDTPDDGIVWRRYPDGTAEADDLVDAQQLAGGHAEPERVLDWLLGRVEVPWMDGGGDRGVIDELWRRIMGK